MLQLYTLIPPYCASRVSETGGRIWCFYIIKRIPCNTPLASMLRWQMAESDSQPSAEPHRLCGSFKNDTKVNTVLRDVAVLLLLPPKTTAAWWLFHCRIMTEGSKHRFKLTTSDLQWGVFTACPLYYSDDILWLCSAGLSVLGERSLQSGSSPSFFNLLPCLKFSFVVTRIEGLRTKGGDILYRF